jgi:hypothetical protein
MKIIQKRKMYNRDRSVKTIIEFKYLKNEMLIV